MFGRMGGNAFFSLTPLPPSQATVGGLHPGHLCSLQDREGASPFQSEALVLGREGAWMKKPFRVRLLSVPWCPRGRLPFS